MNRAEQSEKAERVRAAIKRAGGVAFVAAAFKISRISVYDWITNGYVPPKRAVGIEDLSNGAAKCEEMCDDVDWHVIRGSSPAKESAQRALALGVGEAKGVCPAVNET